MPIVEKEIIGPATTEIDRRRWTLGRKATCHPAAKHFAKGLCQRCYYKTPEWREKARAYNRTPEQKERMRLRKKRYYEDGCQLKNRYGITLEQFNEMLYEQGGMCAVCGSEESGREGDTRLLVDHDHKTGVVRGLLCHKCNMGIGSFRDDPALLISAVRYLRSKREECADVD